MRTLAVDRTSFAAALDDGRVVVGDLAGGRTRHVLHPEGVTTGAAVRTGAGVVDGAVVCALAMATGPAIPSAPTPTATAARR